MRAFRDWSVLIFLPANILQEKGNMKHKFLTVLLSLVAALCLCLGLAACRDDPEKPKDPPAETGSVEGTWSGATGKAANATITIDVDGNAAHMVMKEVRNEETTYVYFSFAKAEDGSYTMTQGSGNSASTTTIKVSAEKKLEYTVVPPASAEGAEAQTTVFPIKAELPAALNITGAKYATIAGAVTEIDFGAMPAIKYGEDALTGVKLVNVGGYKVFTAKYDEDDATVIAFKDGTANKAYVVVTGLISQIVDLSDTKPAPNPPATEPIEGYWTGGTVGIDYDHGEIIVHEFAATVVLDGEQAKVIYSVSVYEDEILGDIAVCDYVSFEKQEDGSYRGELTNDGGTITYELRMIEGKLQMVILDLFPQSRVEINFTATEEPAAAPVVSGIKYTEYQETVVEIDFDAMPVPTVKYGEAFFSDVEIIDIGAYKLLTGRYNGHDTMIVIAEEGGTIYAYTSLIPLETEKYELSDAKP